MTFPTLRKLLFVAAGFVAVGVAVACGPYWQTVGTPTAANPQCPQVCLPGQPCVPPPVAAVPLPALGAENVYYQPVMDSRFRATYVQNRIPLAPPSGFSGTTLSVLDGKIQMQTSDGARMTCEKLTIVISGVDPAEVSVAGKLIKISSGKDIKDASFLQASAEKVTRTATDGAQLLLEGNAKLLYVRGGKKIEVNTDLLSVNLLTGQVLSEMDTPKPTLPPALGPASPPPAPSSPLPPLVAPPPPVQAPKPVTLSR
jgi:hypothetical protein